MSLKDFFEVDKQLFNLNMRFYYYVQNHNFPNKDLSLRDFGYENSIALNTFNILDSSEKYVSIYKDDFPIIKDNSEILSKRYLSFCSGRCGNKILTSVLEKESGDNTIYDYYLNRNSQRTLINKNEISRLIKCEKKIPLESFNYGGALGGIAFANNYMVSPETFNEYSNLISGISFFTLGMYMGFKDIHEKSELNLASRLSHYVEINRDEIKSLYPSRYPFMCD